MREHLKPRATLVLLSVAFALGACGDDITYIQCPPGTDPVGSECIPHGTGPLDGTVTPDATPDIAPDVTTDTNPFPVEDAKPDSGRDSVDTSDAVDTSGPDADVPIAAGAVGAACTKGADCDAKTCLDFPGGYCTRFDCKDVGCPEGSVCMPLTGGNTACLSSCETDADCRPGGQQTCKTLNREGGELERVCHGVEATAASVGSTCEDTLGCAGDMACLPSIPGGYCASLGCEAASCSPGSKCISFGGIPTCLKVCGSDADCGGEADAERRCGNLKALDKSLVGACISGAEGKVVGESCQNDFDCRSGTCQILGEGTCTQEPKLPCFQSNEAEVCGVGFCFISGQNTVGTCTQPCAVGTACPGVSACVGQPGAAEGWCRTSCKGLGQQDDCETSAGFVCTYGWPLGNTTGQGRYVCRIASNATVGAPCGEGQSCGGGACETLAGGGGAMCTTTCADDGYCPFPGSCVLDGESLTCRKACLSILDCEDGATCAPAQGALGSVCQ